MMRMMIIIMMMIMIQSSLVILGSRNDNDTRGSFIRGKIIMIESSD